MREPESESYPDVDQLRKAFHEVVPSPPVSSPGRKVRDFESTHQDLRTRLYPSASTVKKNAHAPTSGLQAMKVGQPRDLAPAQVSGSIIPSGRMAPRMKLVRHASRDLSADIQAAGGDPNTKPESASGITSLAGDVSGTSAVGVAGSNLVAALKKSERRQLVGPSTRGLEKAYRAASRVGGQVGARSDTSVLCLSQGQVSHKSISTDTFDEGRTGSLPHGGFIKSLQDSPLWKDPFRNPNVFLYLKAKTENPYKLSIVDSVEFCSDKFYTLSMNGLVFSTRDRTEFVTVEKFERQYLQYHRIAALPFFKQYSRWKPFMEWKSFVRMRKWFKCRSVLEGDLFVLHPLLRFGIWRVKSLCAELSARRAFITRVTTQTLEQFCDVQMAQRDNLNAEVQEFSQRVHETVMKSCEDTLYNFLDSAGFNVETSIPDEARELLMKTLREVNPSEISFTGRAAMRTQCRKLAKFMKVVDFLVADTCLDVALDSTRDLLQEMQHAVDSISEKEVQGLCSITEENNESSKRPEVHLRHSGEHLWQVSGSSFSGSTERRIRLPLFVVDLAYIEAIEDLVTPSSYSWIDLSKVIQFHPPEKEFHTRLEVMLFDGLTVVTNPCRLLSDPTFRAFISPIMGERGTFGEGQDLEAVIMEDPCFYGMLESMHQMLVQAFRRMTTYASCFISLTQCYLENAKFAKEVSVSSYANANVEQLKALLFTYEEQTVRFKRIKTSQDVGLTRVSSDKLEAILRPSPERCLEIVHLIVPKLYIINHEILLKELSESLEIMSKKSRSVEDFANLTLQYRSAKERAGEMQERYTFLTSLYEMMEGNGVAVGDDTRTASNIIAKVRRQLHVKIEMVESIYDQEHKKFSLELEKQAARLTPRIQALRMDLGHGMIQNPAAEVTEVVEYLVACEKTLASLYTLADRLISWQTILGTGSFERDELEEIESEMSRTTRLWRGIQMFEERLEIWKSTPFEDLDFEGVETEIARFWRIVQLADKQLPSNPAVGRLKNMVEEVKLSVPVVAYLRSETLKERHWKIIDDALGMNVRAQKGVILKHIMEANVKDAADQLKSVATDAEQESILFKILQKVRHNWADMTFDLKEPKERKDVLMLGNVNDLTSHLDDSIVTMGNILTSPHIGPIRTEAEEFSGKLLLLKATLEEWLIFQRTWGYFSSILAAPDMQKQLPKETRAFKAVDAFFKDTTKRAAEDPHCLTAGIVPGLIDDFKRNNEALEEIAKCFKEFLQIKRLKFPRFNFLADEELLELLSRSRDAAAVQPHLLKCFDAIYSLTFEDGGGSKTINAMVSREGERVALGPNLKARGALEDWLLSTEDSMKKVLHRHIKVAFAELEGMNFDADLRRVRTTGPSRNMQNAAEARVEWALEGQPSQVVSTAIQICWTRATEQTLSKEMRGEIGATKTWLHTTIAGLQALVGRIQGKLTVLQRILAVALVTAEVHNRDVLGVLVNQQVNDPQNFLWQAQLRFYWDADTVKIRQSTAKMQYGFEYQGAATRLVITPLTERCWMTITGALDLKLGANPLGPAGTGKTESTKDLAKGLGIQCIVFNCSDQIDYSMPARLFSGLAQTGSWACLDEFNRINTGVLSVIAEQLMVLRDARLAGVEELIFEGQSITLKDHHVIVTMNPGYSGRTELPNNLQVCFRPVAMMVPDYALISENILYSEGFEKAKELSEKVSTLAHLCSEQLSQQPLYDFGMRGVKSVLMFAGQMKRDCGYGMEKNEETIIVEALCRSNLPKLLERDRVLFTAIMGDLFPRKPLPMPSHDNLHRGVVVAAKAMGLQLVKEQTLKVDQLHETLEVRFGVALVGPTGSGKSTLRRLLARASTWLREDELSKIAERHTMEKGQANGASVLEAVQKVNTVSLQNKSSLLKLSRDAKGGSAEQGGSEVDANRDIKTSWPQIEVNLLNPKALSVGELYGQFNPFTMEWRDGVGSSLMRRAATAGSKASTAHWVVFDGPIDALWIESMNTALDDNLTLCLASGERMKLRGDSMHLLFEVEDLHQASPATVSRLGVVYVPQGCTPPTSVFFTWLESFSGIGELLDGAGAIASKKIKARLIGLADLLMWPTLTYMAGRGDDIFREEVITSQIQRVESCCILLQGVLTRQRELHSRSIELNMSQTIVNDAASPRGMHQGAAKDANDTAEGGRNAAVAISGAVDIDISGANRFAPSMGAVDQTFLYSMVWGLGGGLTGDRALAFDIFVRDLVQASGLQNSISLPATGTVFEYYVHFFPPGLGGVRPYEWRSWTMDIPVFRFTPDLPVYEIMVPTASTECYSFLLETNLGAGRPTFLAGASGSGKTTLAAHLFERRAVQSSTPAAPLGSVYSPDLREQLGVSRKCSTLIATATTRMTEALDPVSCLDWRSLELLHLSVQPVLINMSAKISSNGIQAALESKMVPVHKNTIGAPEGKTNVIFVDDVNLPARDAFNSHPPLELLRQLVSEGGFYDRERLFWKTVRETVVTVAAAPPGGARSSPSARFTRLFSVLCLPTQSTPSNTKIFGSILEGFLSKGFITTVAALSGSLVSATLEVYGKVTREMLPTPSRPHYTFNLRDVSKVVQGILLVKNQSVHAADAMVRLWMHEMSRVFGDRLTDEVHRVMFEHMLIEAIGRHFKLAGPGWQRDDLFEIKDPKPGEDYSQGEGLLLFSDVLGTGNVPSERFYEECPDLRRLVRQLIFYQDEYNLGGGETEISLVFFPDTVRHLLRIARILRQPRGNALLIGLAGSGRESLTQLATSIAGLALVRVRVTHNYGTKEFEEGIKKAALAAGTEAKHVIFLLKDAQILDETMLEDIDCFLGSGEMPNLFTADEEAEIILRVRDTVRATGQPDTKVSDNQSRSSIRYASEARCMAFFTARARDHLHIVLCLDPAGPLFRERIRNFPSLVNWSTIDWYSAWPRTALHSVAHRILGPELAAASTEPQACGVGPQVAASIIRSSVDLHEGVEPAAVSFYAQLGRRIYVSPKSFLDFLHTFLNMLRGRRKALSTRLGSLNDGVVKLEETGHIVEGLKQELTGLQPLLESKASEAEGLLRQVDEERKEAEIIKDKVAQDEVTVAMRQEQISILQKEAQKDLDMALPALEEAIKALDSLKRDDISEVKSFQNPPQAVQTVMNAVCLLLSEDQDWDSAKRVLSRNSFMDDLRYYKKEDLTPERRRSLKRYVENENMSVDHLRKVSLAAAGMCMWVHAMDQYADIFEEVKPRVDKVEVLNEELKEANEVLSAKRDEVERIEKEVSLLMQSEHEATKEKKGLENEIKRWVQRLERSEKLTSGLEEEKKRWKATAQEILEREVNLAGDIFVSAAFVSYLGAFTGPFRHMLSKSWSVILQDKGVHVSDGYSLAKVLGKPVVLREWHLQGLPSDRTSVESAIVATTVGTGRWPLLIDPQRQACRWLKHKESKQDLPKGWSLTENGKASPSPFAERLLCANAGNPAVLSTLQTAVEEGKCLLIEDVGTKMDPVLEPVLRLRTFTKGGHTMLSLGDVEVEYNINFRLFLATELSNPLFQPDIAIKVNLIDFTVTKRGLEEQLLGQVVKLEQPEVEERHHDLVTSIANDQKQLLDIEDRILGYLNNAGSGVGILDDETLITTLSKSKATSKTIGDRLVDSKNTQKQIQESRDCYRPVAVRGSLLYFTIAELCRVDLMYQHGLDYFQRLFTNCIINTMDCGSGGLSARLKLLLEKSTEAVYRAISRGLFERHKLLFALLLCTGVLRSSGEITAEEWMLFLQGARPNVRSIFRRKNSQSRKGEQKASIFVSNPDPTELDERSWQTLQQAEAVVPSMASICSSVANEWGRWQDWRADTSAHRAPLPGNWEGKVTRFQKMIVVRALSKTNVHGAATDFVEHHFGRDLIRPSGTAAVVEEVFSDVDEKTPCVFILSRGADPVVLLLKFATSLGMENKVELVSLGKGQGPRAEEMIKVAKANGSWVMLQNCHLAYSWLPTLNSIVKGLGGNPGLSKPGFKLFLSAAPVRYFPIGLLQKSVKLTDEPPRGIRANLRRSYAMQMSGILKREEEEGIQRPPEWKRLLFGLCFFHAVVQERVKFGPLGWNVAYDFGDSDLDTAFKLLERYVDDLRTESSPPNFSTLPIESLVYVTGSITYGGRVTDEWDRRCLLAVLDHFYNASIFGDSDHPPPVGCKMQIYIADPANRIPRGRTENQEVPSKAKSRLLRRLSASSAMIAAAPVNAPPESYLSYIEHIPPEDGPQMFGMHSSADISLRLKESTDLLEAILALQARDTNAPAGQRPDDVVLAVAQELLARMPGKLRHRDGGAINYITRRGSRLDNKGQHEDSLVIVLIQELDNCNNLVEIVRNMAEQLILAVKGVIVMSPELDKVFGDFLINQVPTGWRRRGFTSLKSLGSWMKDLRWRIRFFGLWLERGDPYAFSLPAFFFPQGFLTAVLQKHARKHGVPMNLLGFKYEFPDIEKPEDLTSHPTDGVMVYGMHIEGASWDHETKRLCDLRADQMRSQAPIVHFVPETDHEPNPEDYVCPTYKTSERRGELSTTGVSTNFVVAVEFPTNIPVRQFVLHGTAMLLTTER